MLFDRGLGAGMLFDVGSYQDGLDVLQAADAASFAPSEELAYCLCVREPGVFVPNRGREELQESPGGTGASVHNGRRKGA